MTGATSAARRGRPRISNWREHDWLNRFDTSGLSEHACWMPLPAEVRRGTTPNSIKVRLDWDPVTGVAGKLTTARRYLYIKARPEDHEREPLTWAHVLVASDTCEGADCLNPWHQVRTDRREVGQARMRELYGHRADEVARAKAERQRRARGDTATAAVGAYVAMWVVNIAVGRLMPEQFGLDPDQIPDVRAVVMDKYPRLLAAQEYVLTHPDKRGRARALDTLYKHYPELRAIAAENGALEWM